MARRRRPRKGLWPRAIGAVTVGWCASRACAILQPSKPEPALTTLPKPRLAALFSLLTAPAAPVDPILRAALAEEQRIGQRIAATARSVTVLILVVTLPLLNRDPVILYSLALLLGLVATDLARRTFSRRGLGPRGGHNVGRYEVVLLSIDLGLILALTVLPNPFASDKVPSALTYSTGKFAVFYILLALSTLTYSWRAILVVGVMISVTWMLGAVAIAIFGQTNDQLAAQLQPIFQAFPRLPFLIDPNAVHLSQRLQEVVAFLIVAVILSLKIWRSEQLIVRQAELAAERANLSRYFSPNMVDALAQRSRDIGTVRSAEIAVMFTDIVGFTQLAESLPPERVLEMLRRYYAASETAVFDHGGTLDKYLGDGVMATFGTPRPSPQDARGAVRAARQIVQAIDRMNAAEPNPAMRIEVSVGVHFGPVTMGDVGPSRRLEFAVLGDSVNVASRLEAATRELGCRIVCSDAVIRQAGEDPSVEGFASLPGLHLRGRSTPIDAWTYGARPAQAG